MSTLLARSARTALCPQHWAPPAPRPFPVHACILARTAIGKPRQRGNALTVGWMLGGCIAMRGLPRLRRDSGSPRVAVAPCRARGWDFAPAGASLGLALPQASALKKASLASGCPAELTARLWRCARTAAGNHKDVHAVRKACVRAGGAALFHCHMLYHAAGLLRRPATAALRNRSACQAGRRSLRALAQALRAARTAQSMKVSGAPIF